jgi:DME family drug/metabolite transporter
LSEQKKTRSLSVLSVLLGAAIWGCIGLFVRRFNKAGLAAFEVMQLRITIGFAFVGLYMLLFRRQSFRIRLRDLWCFLGTGLCSLLFFSYCYFTGIAAASLSVMGVLLYTAPVFVMLMSAAFFKEPFTRPKILALLLTFAGCCLVSGLGTDDALSARGLLLGLGAGFGYALYSIFSRFALQRGYDSWTILFYTFLFCACGSAFLCRWNLIGAAIRADSSLAVWALLMGFLTAFLAYLLYTHGLSGMETGRAAILASVEPVVATIVGAAVFHETMTAGNALGVLLVLGGIAVLTVKPRKS